MQEHIIKKIITGSIAEELEIEAGDVLLSVNQREIVDIFDYQYDINDEYIEIMIRKKNGEEWLLEVEKEFDEDLGIEFESSLMDEYRSCHNKCIFCFIDQMPKGMRDTLYFKDDDSRLSFLQGNYVTLTNMSDHDVERIIEYKLAPINISIQTMNPELRCKMLNNRFAGDVLSKLKQLYDAKIPMNGQIVLCKGINDGRELEYSLQQLLLYAPHMQSVSVVPVGLSKFRDGLYPLKPFEKTDAKEVLAIIRHYQQQAMKQFGIHFVHASDEWYYLAGEDMPPAETYDGYVQLENGVGMVRLFMDDLLKELESHQMNDHSKEVSIACGRLIYPTICWAVEEIHKKYPNILIHTYPIRNDFFGERITVTGLLTAKDIIEQLKDKALGEYLVLSGDVLKADEDIFLDDITLDDFQKTLQVPVRIVKSNSMSLVQAVID